MKPFSIFLILVSFYAKAQTTLTSSQQFHKTSGDVLVGVLPALALGSTFVWHDGQKGTLQFSKALASTAATVYVLKLLVKKERPNGESFNSFPSGHTAIAFNSAAFLQKRYGWKVGIPAYALATYVGYSRIEANKHDIWDVVTGAGIGTGLAYLFTKPFKKNEHIEVTMGMVESYTTIGVKFQF